MTNDEGNPNDETQVPAQVLRFRPSSFVIFLGSTHPRNFGKFQDAAENFFARRGFDVIDTDRLGDIETTGFCAPERIQVCAATELFADVMDIGANIKTLAAKNAEIDFWKGDSIHTVAVDMNQARLALDHLSLARQFI